MNRYRVTLTPDGKMFGILDTEHYEYCALPGEDGRLIPLVWKGRPSAEYWLHLCYRRWQAWEKDGGGKGQQGVPPKRWKPHPPETSPFDRGYQFYN